MKKFAKIFLCIFLLVLVVACTPAAETEEVEEVQETEEVVEEEEEAEEEEEVVVEQQEVLIGALAPQTGGSAFIGTELIKGIEIAAEIVNEAGGVWKNDEGVGTKITLVKGDASDNQAAISEAQRLIQQEHVVAIIDGHLSGNALVVSKVCEENDTIYIATVSIMDPITQQGYQNLYRVTVLASTFGKDAVQFVQEEVAPALGIAVEDMKVAVIHEDSGYGSSVGAAAKQAVEDSPMQLVHYASFKSDTNDLTGLIMKLKEVEPDAIVATQYAHDGLLFWEQAESLGLEIPAMVGTGAIHSMYDWIEGTGGKGNYVFSYELGNIDPTKLSEKGEALSIDFRTRYQEKYDTEPSSMSIIGFQGAYTFYTEMLDPAGSADNAAIHEAAAKVDIPEGDTIYGFGIKFDPDTHQNVLSQGCIHQWLDGKFVIVWPRKWADAEPVIPLPSWEEMQP